MKKPKIKKNNNIFKEKNITEDQFIQAVNNISKKLIYKFKFGYHDIDDMKQQAMIFALEGLQNYDSDRPLENFLWTHIRNRLFNFKRDNYFRPNNICLDCPFFDPNFKLSNNQCSKFVNKYDCEIYNDNDNRNSVKKNIMHPTNIDNALDTHDQNNFFELISNKELINLIEEKIETKYRELYLKVKGSIKISKQEMAKLKDHLLEILKNNKIV